MADFDGSKAALFIGEQLLVYLRDDKPGLRFANCWDFPGGGREGDETPEETLAREVMEEFGLEVPGEVVRWKREFAAAHDPDKRAWFFVLRYPEGTESQVVFGDEGQRWRLMDWEEYAGLPNIVPSFAPRMAIWFAQEAR